MNTMRPRQRRTRTSRLSAPLIALLLAACGGGGGEGGPAAGGGTSPVGGGTTAGDGAADTPAAGTTGMRVKRIRFDLDNNGVADGVKEFAYDAAGFLVSEEYVYTGDGTPDADLLSSVGLTLNFTGKDDEDERITYEYDANGRLQKWSATSASGTQGFTYTYDALDRVTQADMGGVRYDISYTGSELSAYDGFIGTSATPFTRNTLTYDGAGRVARATGLDTRSGLETHIDFTFRADGAIVSRHQTSPDIPGFFGTFDFAYGSSMEPVAVTQTSSVSGALRVDNSLDAAGRGIRSEFDMFADGTVDAAIDIEWESGKCESVLFWAPGTIVSGSAAADVPFGAGTGYAYLAGCRHAGF